MTQEILTGVINIIRTYDHIIKMDKARHLI